MNEEQITEAVIKFTDYLKANGVKLQMGYLAGTTDGKSFGVVLGTADEIAFHLSSLVVVQNGYKVTK